MRKEQKDSCIHESLSNALCSDKDVFTERFKIIGLYCYPVQTQEQFRKSNGGVIWNNKEYKKNVILKTNFNSRILIKTFAF